MIKDISDPQLRQPTNIRASLLPSEIEDHTSPPSDRPSLVAWLKLQALRHSDLAERRPWRAEYHHRMAQDASDCAAFYAGREVSK